MYNNNIVCQVTMVDEGLQAPLLALCPQTGKLRVNLDPKITLLIREADCLAKMGVPVPVVASTLLAKRNYFNTVTDTLQVTAHRIPLHRHS